MVVCATGLSTVALKVGGALRIGVFLFCDCCLRKWGVKNGGVLQLLPKKVGRFLIIHRID